MSRLLSFRQDQIRCVYGFTRLRTQKNAELCKPNTEEEETTCGRKEQGYCTPESAEAISLFHIFPFKLPCSRDR